MSPTHSSLMSKDEDVDFAHFWAQIDDLGHALEEKQNALHESIRRNKDISRR